MARLSRLCTSRCPLKDVNRWSVTAGSGGDWERYFWIMGSVGPAGSHQLWGREAGECWVDSGQCVLSMRQMLQTKANHSIQPPPPKHHSIHLSYWKVMKSSSFPCCDSKSHLSRHMQRDPYSNLEHQHDNKGFVAGTACRLKFFSPRSRSVAKYCVFDIKPCGFCGRFTAVVNQIQKHLVTRF